jgi:hypothetical protein
MVFENNKKTKHELSARKNIERKKGTKNQSLPSTVKAIKLIINDLSKKEKIPSASKENGMAKKWREAWNIIRSQNENEQSRNPETIEKYL